MKVVLLKRRMIHDDEKVIPSTEVPVESDFQNVKSGYLCVKKLFFPKNNQTLCFGNTLVLSDKTTAKFFGP